MLCAHPASLSILTGDMVPYLEPDLLPSSVQVSYSFSEDWFFVTHTGCDLLSVVYYHTFDSEVSEGL